MGVSDYCCHETPQEAVDVLAAAFVALNYELAARKPDAPICAPSTVPEWGKRQASLDGRVAFGDTDEEALAALEESGKQWEELLAREDKRLRDE